MFFIGVFGLDQREKPLGTVTLESCRQCGGAPEGEVLLRYRCFHVFFIPVYRWDREYFVTCRGCKSVYRIEEALGKDIEAGTVTTLTYWQLKPLREGRKDRCPHCGAAIQEDFEYCPRCGGRV